MNFYHSTHLIDSRNADSPGHICGADREGNASNSFSDEQFFTDNNYDTDQTQKEDFIDDMDSRSVNEVPSAVLGTKKLDSAGIVIDNEMRKARHEMMDFTCFTLWMPDSEQHQEQQRKQDAYKRSAHGLLLKICSHVTGHTQRYAVKKLLKNLFQWLNGASSRKDEVRDVISLVDSRVQERGTRGGKQAKEMRGLVFPPH